MIKVQPIFLVGSSSTFLRDDGLGFYTVKDSSEQSAKAYEILKHLSIDTESKIIVRKNEDLDNLDLSMDLFIIFTHCMNRFPSLLSLAETGKFIIVSSEEGALGEILDTYEYLADHRNVKIALTYEEIGRWIGLLNAVRHIENSKICVFDNGDRSFDGYPWYKNPLLNGTFDTQYVGIQELEARYKAVDEEETKSLARQWIDSSDVREPSPGDIEKSARLYLAMKNSIDDSNADAAYVIWCAQFDAMLGTKMCFAIAKLNDDGYVTGCWRGENLLPMLILQAISEKPIFFGEVHTYRDGILSLRHCAVTQRLASRPYILRRWRDRDGTVTGYCELPKGEVTLVNAGQGDRIVVLRGNVIDCKDIGGDNCRTTIWIQIENPDAIRSLTGREFAMVYGDFLDETQDLAEMLGALP